MESGNQHYQAPEASAHTDACRALLFAWRLRNGSLPAANDVVRFPCSCAETGGTTKPWRLVPAPHPTWCVIPGEHAWTECTITPMVPKEDA